MRFGRAVSAIKRFANNLLHCKSNRQFIATFLTLSVINLKLKNHPPRSYSQKLLKVMKLSWIRFTEFLCFSLSPSTHTQWTQVYNFCQNLHKCLIFLWMIWFINIKQKIAAFIKNEMHLMSVDARLSKT